MHSWNWVKVSNPWQFLNTIDTFGGFNYRIFRDLKYRFSVISTNFGLSLSISGFFASVFNNAEFSGVLNTESLVQSWNWVKISNQQQFPNTVDTFGELNYQIVGVSPSLKFPFCVFCCKSTGSRRKVEEQPQKARDCGFHPLNHRIIVKAKHFEAVSFEAVPPPDGS